MLDRSDEWCARVTRAVAGHYGVTEPDLRTPARTQPLVIARQMAMYLIRTESPSTPLEWLGRQFRRHHTTVMYAVRTMETLLGQDARLRIDYETLKAKLTPATGTEPNQTEPNQDDLGDFEPWTTRASSTTQRRTNEARRLRPPKRWRDAATLPIAFEK